MTRKQTTVITVLSIIAFILALLVSRRFWFRLDLTKNKSYTISDVSRNLHSEIPDIVNITYYISDRLKSVVPAPGEIEDTLREYAAFSRGKIILSVRDPVKAGVVTMLNEYGLQPRQVQTVEQDQASFTTVYSGIVIEYLDKIDVIPWVLSIDTLEYDLTSRIRSLVRDTERVVGVIVGDYYRQWNEDFSLLNMALTGAGYRVRLIAPGDEIPDNLPVLFVLGGADNFDNWALYRIDRYIQLGGKVLFAVESIFVDTFYNTLEAWPLENPGLLDMIASYGVIVRPELALDRNALEIVYQSYSQTGGSQFRIVRYPHWIGVLRDYGNPNHPVTAGFYGLDLYWSSPLELFAPAGVEAESLFTSSPEGWLMRESFYTNPDILYLMEIEAEETKGAKILGASLSGIFPGFFRGVNKPIREGFDEELPDMPTQTNFSRIIVVGDTDFASNIINATQAEHNLDFLLRAADWLVNDDDIIGIRSRQPVTGRLDKITNTERYIAVMRFSQILNVGLVPLFIIFTGLFLSSRRSKRSSAKEKKSDI